MVSYPLFLFPPCGGKSHVDVQFVVFQPTSTFQIKKLLGTLSGRNYLILLGPLPSSVIYPDSVKCRQGFIFKFIPVLKYGVKVPSVEAEEIQVIGSTYIHYLPCWGGGLEISIYNTSAAGDGNLLLVYINKLISSNLSTELFLFCVLYYV